MGFGAGRLSLATGASTHEESPTPQPPPHEHGAPSPLARTRGPFPACTNTGPLPRVIAMERGRRDTCSPLLSQRGRGGGWLTKEGSGCDAAGRAYGYRLVP